MVSEDGELKKEETNDYAKDIQGRHLFIDNVEGGRKGYYCIGCDKEMEAVIQKKNPRYRSYFRHVPVDVVVDSTPCTFSNREYRETLASDILQRIKTIKVPSVYKYPPRDIEGAPMELEKSKFVTAHKVRSQQTFYEDSEGEIKYGKNPDVDERFLLIRPDVTFFNHEDKPILLIELVVTHKVDDEKKVKLRRLGIDTVSVVVPKSSEQEIEDNFKSTKRIKWEYNGIEANTNYIQVPEGARERVLEFDELQREIFEGSYTCTKARLANTLRSIEKCLLSESYRRVEYEFEFEISRIEKASGRERRGKDVLSKRRGEIERELREVENFERIKRDLDRKISRIDTDRKRVGGRIDRQIRANLDGDTSQLPARIKALLEVQRVVSLFPNAKSENERYKRAYELFRKGTWKTW